MLRELDDHLTAIHALIVRDLMVRFGRHHLGFVWTILEPMLLTGGVMVVWSLIREPTIHGIGVAAFVLTGYMPLTVWRHMTNPLVRLCRNNAALLYHRPVKVADILAARLVLEFLSTSTALTVIYFITTSTGIIEPVQDPGLTLAAWLMTAWFFAGLGLLTSAWTEVWEPAEKFIQPAQYLALPVSGVFFMVSWLPSYAQKLLALNPMVSCFEMFRAGYFGDSVTTYYNVSYLAVWSLALSIAGLVAVGRIRDYVQVP